VKRFALQRERTRIGSAIRVIDIDRLLSDVLHGRFEQTMSGFTARSARPLPGPRFGQNTTGRALETR